MDCLIRDCNWLRRETRGQFCHETCLIVFGYQTFWFDGT